MPAPNLLHQKVRSSLLSLAVPHALGAPLEFGPRITNPSNHTTTMLPNHNFNLPPGHFTDDTSMTLCLARSLLDTTGTSNPLSQAKLYLRWYRTGHMSSVPNHCFDIGNQTRTTLSIWERAITTHGDQLDPPLTLADIKARHSRERDCGNGSLMRVLPCALVAASLEQAVDLAQHSSIVTHPHPRCVDACALYTGLVYVALHGGKALTKDELLSHIVLFFSSASASVDQALRTRFARYTAVASFVSTPESSIKSSGYVLDTLEAALWSFFTTDSFVEGAVRAVNLGDDADTVGAVYGGPAGAFYGGDAERGIGFDGNEEKDDKRSEWINGMQSRSLEMVREIAEEIVVTFHS